MSIVPNLNFKPTIYEILNINILMHCIIKVIIKKLICCLIFIDNKVVSQINHIVEIWLTFQTN